MTKLVHGIENSMDDDDDEIDQQLSSMMKSNKRVVHRRGGSRAGGGKGDISTETKVAAARAAAEKIAVEKKLNQPEVIEKDPTSLTAEAVMKGQEAVPITLSVRHFILFSFMEYQHLHIFLGGFDRKTKGNAVE